MSTYLMVALGGAFGSVARFGISNLIAQRYTGAFPIGTLIVNVTGSFVIGYLSSAMTSESARAFWMVGICGGYTTFSAFSLQNLQLMQSGNYLFAALNTILSLALCMAAVWAGFAAGK
jgi:fluoride exporter